MHQQPRHLHAGPKANNGANAIHIVHEHLRKRAVLLAPHVARTRRFIAKFGISKFLGVNHAGE